jgi:hypothetical protein
VIASDNEAAIVESGGTLNINSNHDFFHGLTAVVILGFLIVEVSRSHSDIPLSVGLLWTTDRPVAETST